VNPEVKAKAEALAEALAQSEEYKAVKEAREELERHEAARIMWRDFRKKQEALESKVLAGETPGEEEVQALQQAYQIVALNPYVRKLLEAEVAFAALMAEVQRTLAAAVGVELPEGFGRGQAAVQGGPAATGRQGQDPGDSGGSARSRLWVPGR